MTPIYNVSGKRISEVNLSDLFNKEMNLYLLKKVKVYFQDHNKRSGTACVKTKNKLSGSGRKLRRQKGLGMARVGMSSAPQRRGGVTIFGPNGMFRKNSVNKKEIESVLKMVLTLYYKKGQITILDDTSLSSHKTKEALLMLKNLNIKDKTIIISDSFSQNTILATRNLFNIHLLPLKAINPSSILSKKQIILSYHCIEHLKNKWGTEK